MTVKEHLAFDRALASLKVAHTFAGHALKQLPESANETRDAILDARDTLYMALEQLEERK